MRIVQPLLLLLLFPVMVYCFEFYDDFEDDDISDWHEVWGEGIWWAQDGQLLGTITYGPAGICPDVFPELQDVSVSTCVNGVHAFGIAARVANDSGILAYVSTDHDVARIRKLEYGTIGQILCSVYVDFPSDVWYDLQLVCNGDNLHFTIDCPDLDLHWELSAVDPTVQAGTVGVHMGTEPGAAWEWFSASSLTSIAPSGEHLVPIQISATPNPFADHVNITLAPVTGTGTILVFDLTGRIVARLPFDASRTAASVTWNGSDEAGSAVPPGVYLALIPGSDCPVTRLVRIL